MVRHFKWLAIVMLVLLTAAGSAFGAVINVNSPYVSAAEAIGFTCQTNLDLDADTTTPLGNTGLGSFISYTPQFALSANDLITFTLQNGTFQDANYFLLVDESQAGVGDIDADTIDTEYQEVGNWVSGGQGSSQVTIRIAGDFILQPQWVLYLVSSNADADQNNNPANEIASDTYDYNIRLRPSCSFTVGQSVNIRATATNAFGVSLPIASASAKAILTLANQFDLDTIRGTSIIDATAPSLRTMFVEEGFVNGILDNDIFTDDTDLGRSSGVVTFGNNLGDQVDDFINLSASNSGQIGAAKLVLTLGGPANNWSGVGLGAPWHAVYFDNNWDETTDGANAEFTATHPAVATVEGNTLPPPGFGGEDDVIIGTNGGVLYKQIWPIKVELLFTDARMTDRNHQDDQFITWGINGYQAIVPYVHTNSLYATHCIVDNASGVPADVYVDILTSESGTTAQNLPVGVVDSTSTARVTFLGTHAKNFGDPTTLGDDVEVTIPLGADERYSVLLTVTTGYNDVYTTCFQNDGVGAKRSVPVLTNEGTVDWRQ